MPVTPHLLGLGMSTIDILVSSSELPRWEGCAPLDDLRLDGGGMAANTTTAFAKLGGRASFLGTYGNDALAGMKVALLEKAGVDTGRMIQLDGSEPAVTLVFVHSGSGERTFASTGRMRIRELEVAELDCDFITGADGLFLDGLHVRAALKAAAWMRLKGKRVCFDAGRAENAGDSSVMALLTLSHVVFGGEGFSASLSGKMDILQAGKYIIDKAVEVYVETWGEKGCWVFSGDEAEHIPAFPVEAIDTTGAGDVFHGAFLLALLEGKSPFEAGRFASAAAAIKCTRRGAQAGCPTRDEVNGFLAECRGV